MKNILNLKLAIMWEYQRIKIFLQNVPNWYEKVFLIKKVKNTVLWMYVIYMSSTLQKGKELQKTNQT